MKKLLTIAAAVVAAAVAQAATVTWEYELGPMEDGNGDGINGLLSFYDGSALLGTADVVDGWAYYNDPGNSALEAESGTTVTPVLTMDFGGTEGTLTLDDIVLSQGTFPDWDSAATSFSGALTETISNAGIDPAWTPEQAAANGWDIQTQPVPEPTSVALLALGLAALGLKRRVA